MSKKNKSNISLMTFSAPEDANYTVSLRTPKDRDKFIKRTESIIRGSKEYKDYIRFLKEHMDLDSCVFFQSVSPQENKKFKVELHHEPFTLYDYVSVVLDKVIDSGEPIDDLMIADEVMALHYENSVGLIPLSKTIHRLVHDSTKIPIPLNMVYGNYAEFLDKYKIPTYLYDKLEEKIQKTKDITEETFSAIVQEFKYIQVDGVEEVKKIQDESANIA